MDRSEIVIRKPRFPTNPSSSVCPAGAGDVQLDRVNLHFCSGVDLSHARQSLGSRGNLRCICPPRAVRRQCQQAENTKQARTACPGAVPLLRCLPSSHLSLACGVGILANMRAACTDKLRPFEWYAPVPFIGRLPNLCRERRLAGTTSSGAEIAGSERPSGGLTMDVGLRAWTRGGVYGTGDQAGSQSTPESVVRLTTWLPSEVAA